MPTVQSCTLQRVQPQTTFDDKNRGHYQLNYDVATNGVVGHRALVNQAALASPHALPSWGQTYSYQGDTDTTVFAQNFTVDSIEGSQQRYVVTVKFDPLDVEGGSEQFEPNPVDRPAIVWADKETFTRIIDKDATGKPIRNLCKRPYMIDYEEEDTHGIIVVEFNVFTLPQVMEYMRFLRRATNKEPWFFLGVEFPPRTVIARDVAAGVPVTENEYTYFRVAIRFVLADEGETWDVPFQEQGFQTYVRRNNVLLTDADGNLRLLPSPPYPEAVNLAADGTKLPDGGTPIFTKWRVKREVDFNLLPFSG